MDTIFALATARGKAGVAVIRVSGPHARDAARKLAGGVPRPRMASFRRLVADGELIDQALVLFFQKGSSFTGEDVIEFQIHGSVAVIDRILSVLGGLDGFRLADPGEFTRRALLNDCLDISQVEGLGDLIEAETEAQRKQAVRTFSGELGSMTEKWRADLVRAAALLEATIDFADEEVPTDVSPEVHSLITATINALEKELSGSFAAERIREGFEVAIVGAPNVGKSTLLNRLAGREAAITSEAAGTTRDVIEVRMDLGGLPVTLLDTAGIRDTDDLVEGMGVERAVHRANAADIRVFLTLGGEMPDFGISQQDIDIVAAGKSDLCKENNALTLSGLTGEGIDSLIDLVAGRLSGMAAGASAAGHVRHRVAIGRAIEFLNEALSVLKQDKDQVEVVVLSLHQAISVLNSLIGRVDVEHVLDEIFASFCLGK